MDIDIPTALTRRESHALRHLASGRRVYEAGALLGYSTCVLGQTAREVTSVDPHFGYPFNNPAPTWYQFLHNLQRQGMEVVRPVRNTFQNHLPDVQIEFAWADLTGEGWLIEEFLRVTEHIPIVALHDYSRGGCTESTHAINRYLRTHYIRRISVIDTLIVLDRR